MTNRAQHIRPQGTNDQVSDDELLNVIADFLDMGHVENIVAMFKEDARYYAWTGPLLTDERFSVRLGVSVLFEHLIIVRPEDVELAIPSLALQLENKHPWVRGEALSVLGIIRSDTALRLVESRLSDTSPQVAEVARDILGIDIDG